MKEEYKAAIEEFKPSRGIQQGNSLLPCNFVQTRLFGRKET